MSFILKCPQCGHEIESKEKQIDIINAAVGTGTLSNPEEEFRGWRLCFNGYFQPASSIDFVGYAIAFPPVSTEKPDHVYIAVAGSDRVQLLKRGMAMNMDHVRWLSTDSLGQGVGPFLEEKQKAMTLLREHISGLPIPE